MKLQDKETLSIATAVSDVLEKKEVKEIKFPHKMYGPKGKEVTAKDQEEHEEYTAKGYSHTKPVKEVDEPTAKGEKDFKAKHKIKKSGEKEDGTVVKEVLGVDEKYRDPKLPPIPRTDHQLQIAIDTVKNRHKGMKSTRGHSSPEEAEKKLRTKYKYTDKMIAKLKEESVEEGEDQEEQELSPKQKKYQAFFQKALKKFGVDSPSELEGDKKKEFFDYVDKNWEGEDEPDEDVKKPKQESVTITIPVKFIAEKKVTIDVDWVGDKKATDNAAKKYKVKIKADPRQGTADITGDNKAIVKLLTDPDIYGWPKGDVLDVWPELK